MVNTGFDPVFARQYLRAYFFSGLPDGAPDRAKIDAALPKMRDMFALLDRELGARPYLAGTGFTLADAFLLPLIHYMRLMPESGEMVTASPNLSPGSIASRRARVSRRPNRRRCPAAAEPRAP